MDGIDITIKTLAQSKHRLAFQLLGRAIESSNETVRKSAGRQLIVTGGMKDTLELIRKYDGQTDSNINEIFVENRERIVPALRAAIMGQDPFLARNAFHIAYTNRFFEVIPPLLTVFLNQDKSSENLTQIRGIYRFVEKYVQALEERKNRHLLYNVVLPEILSILYSELKNYRRNDPDLPILIYLQLYSYITADHGQVSQFLYKPSSLLHSEIYRILVSKNELYIFRLITHCLGSSDPPSVALAAFAKRNDSNFISFFLENIEEPFSDALKTNLANIQHLDWFNNVRNLLDALDENAQSGLVLLTQHIGLSEEEIKSRLLDVFHFGRGKARLDALTALTQFSGEQIDKLVWDAGGDTDPNVQAEALSSLGKREIPNTSSRILQFAASPHEVVRETVQKLMPHFRFQRFFEIFDNLSEAQRRSMFKLVKLLDTQTNEQLAQILTIGEPKNQAKALLCIEYGELVPALENFICNVLTKGELPILRSKAAELLVLGQRELSRSTLIQALHRDPAPEVRAVAKASLEKRPTYWETSPLVAQPDTKTE